MKMRKEFQLEVTSQSKSNNEKQDLRRIQQAWNRERVLLLQAWARRKAWQDEQQELQHLRMQNFKSFIEEERAEWIREIERLVKEKCILQRELEMHQGNVHSSALQNFKNVILDVKSKEKRVQAENEHLRSEIESLKRDNDEERRKVAAILQGEGNPAKVISELRHSLSVALDQAAKLEEENKSLENMQTNQNESGDDVNRRLLAEKNELLKKNEELQAELEKKDNDIKAFAAHMRRLKRQWEAEKRQMIAVFQNDLAEAFGMQEST